MVSSLYRRSLAIYGVELGCRISRRAGVRRMVSQTTTTVEVKEVNFSGPGLIYTLLSLNRMLTAS